MAPRTLNSTQDIDELTRRMKEEELLSLSLGINSDWHSGEAKKRKRKDAGDRKLMEVRDEMMRVSRSKRHGMKDGKGVELINMLISSASTVIAGDNAGTTIEMIGELYRNSSFSGDPVQRLTAYFADALAARVSTIESPVYRAIMAAPSPEEEFAAFVELYRASPYYQFAHFTANQVIMEVFEDAELKNKRNSLHVVDFNVSNGFQWPSLIQSLSDKATRSRPIFLRVTGFAQSSGELKETEMRLASFAKGCSNLVFEFDGVLRGCRPSELKIKKNETLVVNLMFYLQTLRSNIEISDMLECISFLNPSAVVVVEKDGDGGSGGQRSRSFLSRFIESLHYFAAMFDSLDDCLPAESARRLSIERDHLGMEIKRVVTTEKAEEDEHVGNEGMEVWKGRIMESIGFQRVKMSSRALSQAKLLLMIKSHCNCSSMEYGNGGGFRVFERDEGMALSLGWQNRHLITASTWSPMLS
ncbi:hypothetical protein J5N97_012379 [Dioscorea zingiberensis]|uniref:Uncharacterized protein n=1 Tax=Dioscorea zingiberensis TaxID=325984 RepID=A0A9D5HHP2_9LILI|nr:hypothetical protein J5N97_012379 [Dioscorea zingiberensis]